MPTYRELLKKRQGRDRRGRRRRARASRRTRCSSTSASRTSGTRATSRARCTSRAATSSRAIEGVAPDRDAPSRPLLRAAARARRSPRKTLGELGYETCRLLAGGFADWKRNGYDVVLPRTLSPEQRARYCRHLLIPEIGEDGQLKLLESRILLIGAGGLGSPASLYLAAAGVGTLGIIDADIVDESNLQRQIAHSTDTLGDAEGRVSASARSRRSTPTSRSRPTSERLSSENIDRILADGWDMIVDGADNFPTRYLVNDASVWHGIPVVHGSIYRFEGQVDRLQAGRGPVLPLPLPHAAAAGARAVVRRGRRARRAARHRRHAADERGAQARCSGSASR